MAYQPARDPWAPGVAGGTLIRAVDLNHMEAGIVQASAAADNLQLQVNSANTNIADLSSQVALVRDTVNKGLTTTGGNGTITQVNGYPGPIVLLTKSDIGLDKVNNTADVDKPVSTAQQAAIAAAIAQGGGSGGTKASVGLGNVDNTADLQKPVSTYQQAALNLKANLASPTFTGTVSGITKAMVGLGNVDNNSDVVSFSNFGVLPTIYYTGSDWPSRTVPTGYTGPALWNSELYANVPAPTGALDLDRWARKRSS